ncbi:MAG TPA: hypothetical protein VD793_02020 [Gemmatimonadales bacterium]|nr:hypothetical protein [Gemmatimonadales bacterium]
MRMRAGAILVASVLLTSPLQGQAELWRHKWYWGGQAGVAMFNTPTTSGAQTGVSFGGHWLITATRSALYVAFDQMLFSSSTQSAVFDASSPTQFRNVSFSSGRRIQALAYVIPNDKVIQLYIGGGFGISQITDAQPQGTFNTPGEAAAVLQTIESSGTKAFPIFSGGAQYRMGKMALFGQYQFMPEGRSFLMTGTQHVLQGGIRYILTGAREEVTTER